MEDRWYKSGCGKGKLGCIVLIGLICIFGYLFYRVIPVYLEKVTFQEELLNVAGQATIRGWDNSQIIEEVIKVGSSSLFEVDRESIQIQRVQGRPEVSIIVSFSRTEGFLSEYIYVFHFRFLAQGPSGI